MTSNGVAGRWALGVIIVTHLVVYNEAGGLGTMAGLVLASVGAIFSGKLRA